MDRRIRKTRLLLRQGLSKLMLKKSIKEITVKELTELVDINRGTFYLHYKDIYDMVENIEAEIMEEFRVILDAHPTSQLQESPLFLFTEIYAYSKAAAPWRTISSANEAISSGDSFIPVASQSWINPI